MLSASELTKSYAGVKVVNSASVEVASGEIHALVGENGAGKSTMLRMIAGRSGPTPAPSRSPVRTSAAGVPRTA